MIFCKQDFYDTSKAQNYLNVCVCMCVCVVRRGKEREEGREK